MRQTLLPYIALLGLVSHADEATDALPEPRESPPPTITQQHTDIPRPEPEVTTGATAAEAEQLSAPAFLLGLGCGLIACGFVGLYYHTRSQQQLTTMDAPQAKSTAPPADQLAPTPPAGEGTELPEALQHPYPQNIEVEEISLDQQEALIRNTCAQNADYAQLCELFRQETNWHKQLQFMRDTAHEYLQRKGPPTGEQSCYSELLQSGENNRFWFVGDIHGSLDALLRVYAHVLHKACQEETHCQQLILLGDILDRGAQSIETLAVILHLLTPRHPRLKVMVLRGNHDAGLYADGERFDSIVSPAEFIEELDSLLSSKETEEQELAHIMGKAALRLAELTPVMAEITGLDSAHPERTLLCTHGGVPHTDLQAKLAQTEKSSPTPAAGIPYLDSIPENLREAFALDYTWIRLVDKAPRKQPNRGNMGCQMGTKDVNAYRLQHWERSGRAVSFIIRGHDHEQAGWALYSYDEQINPARGKFVQRNCGVLTLNAMDPDLSSCGLFTKRDVALASCAPGTPLTLCILEGLSTEHPTPTAHPGNTCDAP